MNIPINGYTNVCKLAPFINDVVGIAPVIMGLTFIAAGIERGEASPIHYFDLGTDDDEVRPP